MRIRVLSAAYVVISLAAGFWLSQCYVPTYADCAFRCGPTAPLCPAQYECRSDGYCHLPDSTAVCTVGQVTPDLGMDAASPVDAASSIDAASAVDAARSIDAATAVDAATD